MANRETSGNLKHKKLRARGKSWLRLSWVLLFFALYIPFQPVPRALYALGSVSLADDAVVYMYGSYAAQGTVFSGSYYRMQMDVNDIKSTKETLGFYYITVKYTGNAKSLLEELRLSALTVTGIEGGKLYTGYSAALSGRDIVAGGRRVNVQVYVKGNEVTVGSPAIYGGY